MPVELRLEAPLRFGSSPERTHWNFKFPAPSCADSDCRSVAQPFDDPKAGVGSWATFSSVEPMIPSGTPNTFPEGKLADEPPVDDGFYYDFDLPRRLTPQGREAARTVFNP